MEKLFYLLLPNKVKRFDLEQVNAFFFLLITLLVRKKSSVFLGGHNSSMICELNLTEFVTFCGPFRSLYL